MMLQSAEAIRIPHAGLDVRDAGGMDATRLATELRNAELDEDSLPQGTQEDLCLKFATLYEDRGLITDTGAPPLWKCCPNAAGCWAGALDARPSATPEDGNISLPWVGPRYRAGGVLILGMNFNDASGLAAGFQLADGDLKALSEGDRRVSYGIEGYRGTMFPYRSTRSASLVMSHLRGEHPVDRDAPEEVAEALNDVVRLQTIKCSPRNDERSKPTDPMWFNCPPFLLGAEFDIAQPGAVVAFGYDVHWAVRQLNGYKLREEREHLSIGEVPVQGDPIPVYMLNHPSAPTNSWQPSQEALLAALT